ncbi:MAG: hypothetical protein EOP39_25170, partial [Rubrivivax sp.]
KWAQNTGSDAMPSVSSQRRRGMRWLETLGMASLPVFCAHLVVVLLVLSVWGGSATARPLWGDALMIAACFGVLYAVARVSVALDRKPPRGKRPVADKTAAGVRAASSPSTSGPAGPLPSQALPSPAALSPEPASPARP